MGEHKKIIVEHYPVDRLPADLRAGVEPGGTVRITVEEDGGLQPIRPLSAFFGKLERVHDDPVRDIQNLRDEWE